MNECQFSAYKYDTCLLSSFIVIDEIEPIFWYAKLACQLMISDLLLSYDVPLIKQYVCMCVCVRNVYAYVYETF